MDLTIREIKKKQKELNVDLVNILNKFNEETGLRVRGAIDYGVVANKPTQKVYLEYNNPFND